MRKTISESRLGAEYIADVISTCEQNGVECIVDDKNNDIFYYDPKRHKYGDDKLLRDNDVSIWDIVSDEELFDTILFDASGAIFKDFAERWNDLQKKGDDDVFKTRNCGRIDGPHTFEESKEDVMKKFEKFRAKWKALGDKPSGLGGSEDGLSDDDKAHLERLKHMDDDFGDRVNGIEAQVSEGDDSRDWSASEGEIEIEWTTDKFEDFGLSKGDTATYLIDYDLVDDEDDLVNEVCRMIGKEYPDMDFEPDDFIICNAKEFWDDRSGGKVLDDMEDDDLPIVDDNDDVVEDVPQWATDYIMYGDNSTLEDDDQDLVDAFVEELREDGLELDHPIDGSENEFNSYPAFGKACATVNWSCRKID